MSSRWPRPCEPARGVAGRGAMLSGGRGVGWGNPMVALATRLAGCYLNPLGGDLWLEYVAAGPKVSAWSRPES